ncbi:MAG: hydroxyacylglutathione hydrolase [Magnetococcales bacterium]|nr:hydroxyacylglutathione hydrolase [Magnetococcales bacterium]
MNAISLPVHAVPALKDNHIWIFPTGPDSVAVVDPGEDEPVNRFLTERSLRLSHILLTHHHLDHIGGVKGLCARHAPVVIGARADAPRLPALSLPVGDEPSLPLGHLQLRVMTTPGHTTGHVVYHVADALFVGDTLFRYGCGRLFEGTPAHMWHSLLKIRSLPDHTRLFPAHEYTLGNLRFAQALEPDNPDLQQQFETVCRQTDDGAPTLPVDLHWEKQFNPFLRCDDPRFAAKVDKGHLTPVALFAHLREKRNHF